jgi:hypothetical protein
MSDAVELPMVDVVIVQIRNYIKLPLPLFAHTPTNQQTNFLGALLAGS